ncbi:hypothetical protein ACO2Q8_03855 [Larkinella sp. VNQ87]|uniref:hypothetical protein n=1 Tax=Larkinella sp. VNQ87 TaxID=3400921 RepID=UPI003C0DF1E9
METYSNFSPSRTKVKILSVLLVLAMLIVCIVVASPPHLRGVLNIIGSLELIGLGCIAWMVDAAHCIKEE